MEEIDDFKEYDPDGEGVKNKPFVVPVKLEINVFVPDMASAMNVVENMLQEAGLSNYNPEIGKPKAFKEVDE